MSTLAEIAPKPRVKKLAFEALVKGAKIEDNPTILRELKPLYNLKRPEADYSPQAFVAFLEVLRLQLYPAFSPEQGLLELGRLLFHGFHKGTVVGGIVFSALKIMSQFRLGKSSERIWQDMGVGEFEVKQPTPDKIYAYCRNFIVEPPLLIGAALEGMKAAGAREVNYRLEKRFPFSPGHYNFVVIFELG
jgi:hypothetical protein